MGTQKVNASPNKNVVKFVQPNYVYVTVYEKYWLCMTVAELLTVTVWKSD